jgi:hypothetical protein
MDVKYDMPIITGIHFKSCICGNIFQHHKLCYIFYKYCLFYSLTNKGYCFMKLSEKNFSKHSSPNYSYDFTNSTRIWDNNSPEYKFLENLENSVIKIQRNWRVSKWNGIYREFLTQVLTVPPNHDSLVGKLFPNGGYDYINFVKHLTSFNY